jgi:hypothetical protein
MKEHAMAKKTPGRSILFAIFAIANLVAFSPAQEAGSAGQTSPSATEAVRPGSDQNRWPEAEVVWSPSFRSGSLVQPIWSDVSFEGHYFGGDENNVGFIGGSWTFHEDWKLAPGFGVLFGDDGFRTMPALSLRWGYEQGWFVTEGLLVHGLLHTELFPEGTEPEPGQSSSKSVVPFIADGDHVSARWKRMTVGGTWERMQFREGREWKGGLRVAYRVLPALSVTFFAMGPGSEIRGGILFQPEEKK